MLPFFDNHHNWRRPIATLMQAPHSYEVIVRRKVPYLTNFLFQLLMVFVIILSIIDLFFLPARNAPPEMQVAYFILVIPAFVKKALLISIIGFLAVLPLYLNLRFYRKAALTFLSDNISIIGRRVNIDIPVNSLSKVYCMDDTSLTGKSRENLTIYFQEKRNRITRVRLKHYLQADEFMERLLQYENVDFKGYDFNVSPDIDNED
jgi:hypothetical protein